MLTATRGPLPLHLLVEKAGVSRSAVLRLEKKGWLLTWEEPITPDEDAWDTDFTPPANILERRNKKKPSAKSGAGS